MTCVFKAGNNKVVLIETSHFFTHQVTYSLKLSHRLESTSTTSFRSLLTHVHCEWVMPSVYVGHTCWRWWGWAGSGVWTESRQPEEPESEWSSPTTSPLSQTSPSCPSPRILPSRVLPPPSCHLRGRREVFNHQAAPAQLMCPRHDEQPLGSPVKSTCKLWATFIYTEETLRVY